MNSCRLLRLFCNFLRVMLLWKQHSVSLSLSRRAHTGVGVVKWFFFSTNLSYRREYCYCKNILKYLDIISGPYCPPVFMTILNKTSKITDKLSWFYSGIRKLLVKVNSLEKLWWCKACMSWKQKTGRSVVYEKKQTCCCWVLPTFIFRCFKHQKQNSINVCCSRLVAKVF